MLRKLASLGSCSLVGAVARLGPSVVRRLASNVGETHVGQDELYRTGNFNYDEFFEDINALQGSSKSAVE